MSRRILFTETTSAVVSVDFEAEAGDNFGLVYGCYIVQNDEDRQVGVSSRH